MIVFQFLLMSSLSMILFASQVNMRKYAPICYRCLWIIVSVTLLSFLFIDDINKLEEYPYLTLPALVTLWFICFYSVYKVYQHRKERLRNAK